MQRMPTDHKFQRFSLRPASLPLDIASDGEIWLFRHYFASEDFTHYQKVIPWQQHKVFVFGKWHLSPRLSCFMGQEGISYEYSGQTYQATLWQQDLQKLSQKLTELLHTEFNSVLCNYYRHGLDKMGRHRDNEKELGDRPIIASISLGATREFRLYGVKDKKLAFKLDLAHGDLLVMSGDLQEHYAHEIPRQSKIKEGRINLTFRLITS